jgi:membrane-associated phospholipid phosphatase
MARVLTACLVVLLSSPLALRAQDTRSLAATQVAYDQTADSRASSHPGFGSIFRSLKGDFTQTVTADNLVVLGLGGSGAFGAHSVDRRVADARWGARGVFEPGDFAGSALVQSSGALATYLVGRAFDAPRVSQVGSELIRAQIVSQTLTQGIKFTTTRTRPDGTSLSLPSGHTSSAFATATVLQSNFGWKVGVPAYAAAAWIGASRVQMKRHFVSDVIAGAAIGLVAGRAVTVGRGDMRFAMVPAAAPGGLGVNFVHLGSR